MKSAAMSAYKRCLVGLYPKFLLMPYLSCNITLRSEFRVVMRVNYKLSPIKILSVIEERQHLRKR
jgi:hypothetical protein